MKIAMRYRPIIFTPALLTLMSIPLLFFSEPWPPQLISVPGGTLTTVDQVTGEIKTIHINDFYLDKHLVTVAEFEKFVRATGYITQAEQFGQGAVFDESSHQWALVSGANYRHPQGPDKPGAAPDHPVTQVSWNDAVAFARWKGKRLPTQWEWEYAAKNARETSVPYTWGNSLVVTGKYRANTWQGSFPLYNTVKDGYRYTSPVGIFGENELGLTDMGGNVWQWCSDDVEPGHPDLATNPAPRKVLKGGSFLCDASVCHRYQISGRSSSTPETSLMHAGFRCAIDARVTADF